MQKKKSAPQQGRVSAMMTADKTGPLINTGLFTVIPAFNEEIAIGSVVLQARKYSDWVIVVDDGSADRTAEVARMAGAEVIQLDHNTGKAYALLLGLRRARELNCSAAIMMDADGQHITRDIPRLAAPVLSGEVDFVIGSRFIRREGNIPIYRMAGQKTLNALTNLSTGHPVSDTQSGFRVLSRKALDYLDFRSDGYNVESDMIAHFIDKGLVIREVPIEVRYDVPNRHKKHPLTHGLGVMSRLINLISYRRPLLAFGIPGAVLTIGGLMTELWVFTELYTTQEFHYIWMLGGAFILLVGILLVMSGLILNTLVMIVKEH
jgi:glycosyltransferase involved in cell wall biosynthesis